MSGSVGAGGLVSCGDISLPTPLALEHGRFLVLCGPMREEGANAPKYSIPSGMERRVFHGEIIRQNIGFNVLALNGGDGMPSTMSFK
jgi:hypothetical protein